MFNFELPDNLNWRAAVLPKKSGGVRKIKIPNDDLKKTQRDILQYLYSLRREGAINIASFAHGFVPFKNTMTSIAKHPKDSKCRLCCDVKDFFDNFPIEPVRNQLISAGIPEDTVDKILTACTYKGSFPQGSPASPYLTNIGMFEVDLMLDSYAKSNGFVYTRYADDITFSLMPEQEPRCRHRTVEKDGESVEKRVRNPYMDIFYGIETILKNKLGLKLKHSKDHIIWRRSRTKPQVLGVIIREDGKGYNAPKKMRLNARAAVHNLAKKLKAQRGKPTPADWSSWAEIKGTIQYMDYVRSYSNKECATADTFIQERYYDYLTSVFDKRK